MVRSMLHAAVSAADAAWAAAWATIALAVLALLAAVVAWRTFRNQADQLRILQEQAGKQEEFIARQMEVFQAQLHDLQATQARRELEDAERRRAQAEQVFLTEEHFDHDPAVSPAQRESGTAAGPVVIAKARNSSGRPIYHLTLSWHRGTAPWGARDERDSQMPGDDWTSKRALPDDLPRGADPQLFGAVLWFDDAAGVRWRRRPDGQLDEIPPDQASL
jgi:hypothetical protein